MKFQTEADWLKIFEQLNKIVASNNLSRYRVNDYFQGHRIPENYQDITQRLFLALYEKNRFRHYLESGMSDQEITLEIRQIELKNMLIHELKKFKPEAFRIAQRITTIIRSSAKFKEFKSHTRTNGLGSRIFGLTEWADDKIRCDDQETEERVKTVSIHNREMRMVGCKGDTQIVISNTELEKLIISVFKAIDSPVDVKNLRSLVMSRISIMDVHLSPISGTSDHENDDQTDFELPIADQRETPEERLLRLESEIVAAGFVEVFLENLEKSVNGKAKQYRQMIGILWHYYLLPDGGTQLEVSELLGVSDSLVSDYRKRIESNLRSLSFAGLDEARSFQTALKNKISELIQ